MTPQTEWLEKDFYAVLGVPEAASEDEIRSAYRRLARRVHPDANLHRGADDRFKEITGAYEVLGDPDKRRAYDELRRRGSAPSGSKGRGRRVHVRYDTPDLVAEPFRSSGFPSASTHRGGPTSSAAPTAVDPHGDFERRGDDLTLTVPITYPEAVLGTTLTVPTLDGEPVRVRIPPGTRTGRVLRVPNRGATRRGSTGDLLLEIQIDTPSQVSASERRLLQELAEVTELPPRRRRWEQRP